MVGEKLGDQIGPYKLLELLGEGGCGIVYTAEQKSPVRRRVALKVIKPGMDSRQVLARFEAERQALALMDHPNIAKVLDAGATEAGRPYFVMELVKGERLTEYCDKNQLSTQERLELFIQVCQAIQHAHQKGIIHRDIKPSNILVAVHDNVPVPKVIDFGIAKATTGQPLTDKTVFTAMEQFIGTPAYMSPEQAEMRGLDIDTRSDIYALGVLLYELLTGRTPFDARELIGMGLDEVRRVIREEEPPRPSTRLSSLQIQERTTVAKRRQSDPPRLIHLLRGDLDWIVMKSLEKDRTRRYETASGLALDVQRFLRNEPVLAGSPSSAYRLKKFIRRNWAAVAAAATIAILLLAGTAVSTGLALVAKRARDQERLAKIQARRDATLATAAAARAQEEELKALRAAYSWAMVQAQVDWDKNHLSDLRSVLAMTQANRERGFEWDFWQRRCHLELVTLRTDGVPVLCAASSPDGRFLAAGCKDGQVRIWNARTGAQAGSILQQTDWVCALAFSPDSHQIASGSEDGAISLWDLETGQKRSTFRGHSAGVRGLAFSPDGKHLASASWDKLAKVWELAGPRELLALRGHQDGVMAVAFSPDGSRIATGSLDRTVRLWEANSGRELGSFGGHSDAVLSVAFSPDGKALASASWDQTVKIRAADSGQEGRTLRAAGGGLRSVAFSPNGRWISSGGEDRSVHIWNAETGAEVLTAKGHLGEVRAVSFTPDSEHVISGSADGSVKVWSAERSPESVRIGGFADQVWSAAFSPEGQRVVAGSWDGAARVFDARTGQETLRLNCEQKSVAAVAFSPDGHWIATGGLNGTIKLWDPSNGRLSRTFSGHFDGVRSIAFSPDGRRLASAGWDRSVRVWELATGAELFQANHMDTARAVAFSPDGTELASGSLDRTVRILDASNGHERFTLSGHTQGIMSVAFSADGQQLASAGEDGTIKLWNTRDGSLRLDRRTEAKSVLSVAFSPDGQRLVSGSSDGRVTIRDPATGHDLLTLKAHDSDVSTVSFSPDGHRLLTAGYDRTVRIWQGALPDEIQGWLVSDARQGTVAEDPELAPGAERRRAGRVLDPGALKDWLLAGPVPYAGIGPTALDQEQVKGEATLRPGPGESLSGAALWREARFSDGVLDWNRGLGGLKREPGVVYAVSYLQADRALGGLQVLVASTGHARVYVNGRLVYAHYGERPLNPDQDKEGGIELHPGLNSVVFKLVSSTGDWRGSVRLTDGNGRSVPGINPGRTP